MRWIKIFTTIFVVILFNGCGNEEFQSKQNDDLVTWTEYMEDYLLPNSLNNERTFDYYEISNGKILTTQLNMDILNVYRYVTINEPSYLNSLYEVNNKYHLTNEPLNIDTTFDAMIFYSYDTLTNVAEKVVYRKNYGIYEISKSFCVISSDENNCTSYMYINN